MEFMINAPIVTTTKVIEIYGTSSKFTPPKISSIKTLTTNPTNPIKRLMRIVTIDFFIKQRPFS